MNTETLLHVLLALTVLVAPIACAYIVVRRIARRNAPPREESKN